MTGSQTGGQGLRVVRSHPRGVGQAPDLSESIGRRILGRKRGRDHILHLCQSCPDLVRLDDTGECPRCEQQS